MRSGVLMKLLLSPPEDDVNRLFYAVLSRFLLLNGILFAAFWPAFGLELSLSAASGFAALVLILIEYFMGNALATGGRHQTLAIVRGCAILLLAAALEPGAKTFAIDANRMHSWVQVGLLLYWHCLVVPGFVLAALHIIQKLRTPAEDSKCPTN